VPGQDRQQFGHVQLHDRLMVLGADRACHLSRLGKLAEACLLEAHGERLHGPVEMTGHQGRYRRGIDPPREEDAQGDIALQAQANTFVQERPDPAGGSRGPGRAVLG